MTGFRIPRLYAIIDAAHTGNQSAGAVCDSLLAAGVKLVQYRDKRASSRQLYVKCIEVVGRTRGANALLVVNDRADVALAVGADGVHVGQGDLPVELARRVVGPGKLVGCSTHNVGQVEQADRSAADYVAIGPVFPTQTKEQADPAVGLEGVREARRLTRKPLVAIGGITLKNAATVIEAGADSVAVISDLMKDSDVGARARQYLRLLGEK